MRNIRSLSLVIALIMLLTACGSGTGDKAFEGADYQEGSHVFFVFTSPT